MPNKFKLLFVDDEPFILEALSQIFDRAYEVHTASSGQEALERAKAIADLAVIISDQRMPGLRGIEVLKSMRTLSPNTVRILLTGYADADAILDSVNVGEVFRYIKKPWKTEEIEATVSLAVSLYQAKTKQVIAPAQSNADAQSDAEAQPAADVQPDTGVKSGAAMAAMNALSTLAAQQAKAQAAQSGTPAAQMLNQASEQQQLEEKFFNKLAQAPAAQSGAVFEAAFHGKSGKPKILIVDDEPAVLTSLSELLSGEYDVITCTSADEALQKLANDSFVTLLLTDQRMPKKTGADLLIESKSYAPLVPKILITAYTDVEDIVRLINEGQIHRYIQKPWNGAKLRELIAEAVAIYEHQISAGLKDSTPKSSQQATPAPQTKAAQPSADALKAMQAMQALGAMQKKSQE